MNELKPIPLAFPSTSSGLLPCTLVDHALWIGPHCTTVVRIGQTDLTHTEGEKLGVSHGIKSTTRHPRSNRIDSLGKLGIGRLERASGPERVG